MPESSFYTSRQHYAPPHNGRQYEEAIYHIQDQQQQQQQQQHYRPAIRTPVVQSQTSGEARQDRKKQRKEEKQKRKEVKKKKKKKKNTVPMYKMFRYSKVGDKLMVLLAILCSILVGILQPGSIVIFGLFVMKTTDQDDDGDATPSSMAKYSALILIAMGTAIMMLAYVGNCLWTITGENQARRIRQLYVHAIMRQDMQFFDQAKDGSLISRLETDTQLYQDAVSDKYGAQIRTASAATMGVLMSLVFAPGVSGIVIALTPVLFVVGYVMDRILSACTKKVQDTSAEAGKVAEQALGGIQTVFSFNLQNRFSRLYDTELTKICQAGSHRALILGISSGSFLFVLFSIFSLALWRGGQLASNGSAGGPQVMIAFFCIYLGAISLIKLPSQVAALSSGRSAAYTIFETIKRVPTIDTDSQAGLKLQHFRAAIEFRNVNFSYPTRTDIPILKNLNLTINPGMTVAFVGSSGSGKSTCIQLLQRFYDPRLGQVLLSGHDFRDLNVQWLRSQIGVVSQEPVLFNMTIRQNLLLGIDKHVSQDRLVSVCQQANCHSFISSLPNGYDTLVGEHGGMLSGGQKQRIAIARAILKDPPILLLDEATSALDTQSERLVQRALDAASAGRTTIVVAHRLSTIRNADLIVVMGKGEILELGTHNQLVRYGGAYTELVQKQQIATNQQQQIYIRTTEKRSSLEEEMMQLEKIRFRDRQVDHHPHQRQSQQQTSSQLQQIISRDNQQNDHVQKQFNATLIHRISTSATSVDSYELRRHRLNDEMKSHRQTAPVRKMLQQVQNDRLLIFIGCIGALIAGAVYPLFAFSAANCVSILFGPENEIASAPFKGINFYAFIFFVFAILAFIGYCLQNWMFELMNSRYTARIRSMLLGAYLKQEVGFFDHEDNSTGVLVSKLAVDTKIMSEIITKVPAEVLQAISTAICGLVIAFAHNWILTLIAIGMSPFLVGSSLYQAQLERRYQDESAKTHKHGNKVAGEVFQQIRTVASLGKQAHFESKYVKTLNKNYQLARRQIYLSSFLGYALSQGFILYVAAVIFSSGIIFMEQGRLQFSDLFICMLTLMISMQGVGQSSTYVTTFVRAKTAAIGVFEIIERQSNIDPDIEGIEMATEDISGDISFRNIGFCYPTRQDQPVFEGGFNLCGRAGQTVALVGGSGCGKSTIIGMLQRFYDPFTGTAHLDHNIKNFTLGNLRSHMALVGQEPVLFDLSIGENIRFGVEEGKLVTQEQIEEAARAANIHKFIINLPDGYNTRVGDKGSQLSGGQKQRIAIARALIRKPKVLLLDEATSALDSESEKLVQEAIDNIVGEGGRTTITIAHRLSTIQNADLICVIKNGRVYEQGTHCELLHMNGEYALLVQEQSLHTY